MRYGNTGSEGTMICVRLARARTGKPKILKFWGHFHGLYDYVMYNSHSPLTPVEPGSIIPPQRESAGMPEMLDDLVVVVPWKDEAALERAIGQHGDEIGGIIMEPINYNQGWHLRRCRVHAVRPRAGHGQRHRPHLRRDAVGPSAQGRAAPRGNYGVTPDLCVLGTRRWPTAARLVVIAGKAEMMNQVNPQGEVCQSGTFTGNPPAINCALASVNEITSFGFYDHIEMASQRLYSGMTEIFDRAGVPARVQGLGARFGIFFGFTHPVERFDDTLGRDREMGTRFIRACADSGVYFHDYGDLVAGHHGVSASHSLADIDEALDRIETAAASI